MTYKTKLSSVLGTIALVWALGAGAKFLISQHVSPHERHMLTMPPDRPPSPLRIAQDVQELKLQKAIFRWGTPSPNYQEQGDYLYCYDGRTKNPAWVMEHLTRQNFQGFGDRAKSVWAFDGDAVPKEQQSLPGDYDGSGYDRGHLAPAGAHRQSQKHTDATFFMNNVSPQVPSFNRGPWRRIELYIQDLLEREDVKELWVVTIPLYLPHRPLPQGSTDADQTVTYKTIGPDHIAVPTHFAKCLLAEFDGQPYCWSYVLPNEALDLHEAWAQHFRVDVDFIEHWSGLDLWNKIPKELQDKLEAPEQDAKEIGEEPAK